MFFEGCGTIYDDGEPKPIDFIVKVADGQTTTSLDDAASVTFLREGLQASDLVTFAEGLERIAKKARSRAAELG